MIFSGSEEEEKPGGSRLGIVGPLPRVHDSQHSHQSASQFPSMFGWFKQRHIIFVALLCLVMSLAFLSRTVRMLHLWQLQHKQYNNERPP